MPKETVTNARTGKSIYFKGCFLGKCENMSKNKKCDKCNGEGGILWITSTGVDAMWEFCDRCNGTGEIEKKEEGASC